MGRRGRVRGEGREGVRGRTGEEGSKGEGGARRRRGERRRRGVETVNESERADDRADKKGVKGELTTSN